MCKVPSRAVCSDGLRERATATLLPSPFSPCLGDNGSAGDEFLPQQIFPCCSSGDAPLPSHLLTVMSWLAPVLMSSLRGEGTTGLGTAPHGDEHFALAHRIPPRPTPLIPLNLERRKKLLSPANPAFKAPAPGSGPWHNAGHCPFRSTKAGGRHPAKSIFCRAACGRGEGGGPGCQ